MILVILVEGYLSNIPMKFEKLAILVGSHLCNIPVKFESHWPNGFEGDSI